MAVDKNIKQKFANERIFYVYLKKKREKHRHDKKF